MPRFASLIVLALVASLLAGCAGGESAAIAPTSTTVAPPPTVTIDTGSIAGQILSEEMLPLAGVTVSPLERGTPTSTDADGRFTLNELPPGSLRLYFEKLGFEAIARKVEVRAGEITHVNATLKPIPVAAEPYHRAVSRVYQIHVDHDYIGQIFNDNDINNSAINGLRCSPCESVIHYEKGPSAVLSEAEWQTGPGPINTQAYTEYWKDWTETEAGVYVCFVGFPVTRTSVLWPASCLTLQKTEDKLKQHIYGGFTTISFNQRVFTWTTFGYNGDLPDNYTALPPQ